MKKRFLAALLSLCMTLTLLPTTAFAAVSDSLGNTPEENQAILEQVSALTGDSSDQVLSMLNALGLLDEDGNFKVDQTITLDGQVLTLAAVMELLENPATDLTRIADVDGTPVALGDLKTMIQIEQELQRSVHISNTSSFCYNSPANNLINNCPIRKYALRPVRYFSVTSLHSFIVAPRSSLISKTV